MESLSVTPWTSVLVPHREGEIVRRVSHHEKVCPPLKAPGPFIPTTRWSGQTYRNPRLRNRDLFFIDNAESLAAFWNASFYSTPPPVPEIDFELNRVVIAVGGMLTGCPSAHVDSLKLDQNPIAVFAHTFVFAGRCYPGCFYIHVSPWEAALVPRFEPALEPHWSSATHWCSPY